MGAKIMAVLLGVSVCLAAAGETRLVIGDGGLALAQTTCTRQVAAGVSNLLFASLPRQVQTESLTLSEPAGGTAAKIVSLKLTRPEKAEEPDTGLGFQCTLDSPAAGERSFTLTYLVNGLSWQADYNAFLSADRKSARFEGWFSLSNQTGGQYDKPAITLARSSADMQQACPPGMQSCMVPGRPAAGTGFANSSLMPLEGVETLPPYTTIRLPMISTAMVAVDPCLQCDVTGREYREEYPPEYMGGQPNAPAVWWWIEVDNSLENGMGKLLPKGTLRVFQQLDQGMTYANTTVLDTAQPGQKMRVRVAPELGITVKKKTKQPGDGMRQDGGSRTVVQTITLTSTLDGPREVRVFDRPEYGGRRNAAISDASDLYKTLDDGRLEFRVEVTPGTERVNTYTIAM